MLKRDSILMRSAVYDNGCQLYIFSTCIKESRLCRYLYMPGLSSSKVAYNIPTLPKYLPSRYIQTYRPTESTPPTH